MTPLERAARTLFRADYPDQINEALEIEELGMIPWERREWWYYDTARALLLAIREPSEAMEDAASDRDTLGYDPPPSQVWLAMIDAALAEK